MTDALLDSVLAGDRGALARALTEIESRTTAGRGIEEAARRLSGQAWRIGVTGPPGTGKSTLIGALIPLFRSRGSRVGAVLVDVSSTITGGALLGDRVRMGALALDDGIFLRSVATGGALGGLAEAVPAMADLLDAAGYGVVFIETAGVGQTEADIALHADVVVVVASPGQGDVIQAMKAGLMEVADVFVVTRGDDARSAETALGIRDALALRGGAVRSDAPVLIVSAPRGEGLDAVVDAIAAEVTRARSAGGDAARGRRALAARIVRRGAGRLADFCAGEAGERIVDRLARGAVGFEAAVTEALRGAVEEEARP